MIVLKSRVFWTLIAGLVVFVVKQFWPEFPVGTDIILMAIVAILSLFGITPELRARGLK